MERKGPITGEIVEIWDETPDVKTFRIEIKDFWFIPGDYCFLSFEKDETKYGPKPFTFSSAPNGNFVDITIKKIGNFTQAIHTLQVGNKITILGPQGGKVIFDESVKEDIIFVCMGTGIAPFMSAMRYAHKHDMTNKITMLCCNRTKEDIIFKKDLEKIGRLDNNKIVHFISREEVSEPYVHGRISKEGIISHVENTKEKLWYLCGSPSFVASLKQWLDEMGLDKDKIRVENFTLPSKSDVQGE